jgi:cellulose synthase/poly-beta-1,6-N-acetylglucosamine synthase-like glycosyltransferase
MLVNVVSIKLSRLFHMLTGFSCTFADNWLAGIKRTAGTFQGVEILTTGQVIYIVAAGLYVFFFLLFTRFFFWKRYSEKHFWNKRPKLTLKLVERTAREHGRDLPFITIMVPARDESDVIGKTVQHMSHLNYPKDKYEVVVVTDGKETIANEQTEQQTVAEAMEFFSKALYEAPFTPNPAVRDLALDLLTNLCLTEYRSPEFQDPAWLVPQELRKPGYNKAHLLIQEIVHSLLNQGGRVSVSSVYRYFRRAFPGISDAEVARLYPNFLCVSMPVVSCYSFLTQDGSPRLMRNVLRHAAQANHRVTQDILYNFTRLVADNVHERLSQLVEQPGQLEQALHLAFERCFPTTAEVVERTRGELRMAPAVRTVAVPANWEGGYEGHLADRPIPSTKGRALNYALPRSVSTQTEILGFYDAESRPDLNVLLYIAYKRITEGKRVRIWQGPIFQVRNFYEMGPFSKVASIYQAVTHDWYLPIEFKRIPFVGGTNLFVERELMDKLQGFDDRSLTEDLELGTRAYLKEGVWPEYLPFPSSEQTPSTFRAFFKQRLRWGSGHLQVMEKIRNETDYDTVAKNKLLRWLTIKGPLEWTIYQSMTVVPFIVLTLWAMGLVDVTGVPAGVRYLLSSFTLVYFMFTYYAFFRYYPHIDTTARPVNLGGKVLVFAELMVLPLASFFFPAPFTGALVLKRLHRNPRTWEKTPRTKE